MESERNNPQENLLERLQSSPRPVVVEFWAAWCAPCRAMEPALLRTGDEFKGKVDLWRINADQQPEMLRSLKIFGIPTMILFQDGQEIARRTGALSPNDLQAFFHAAEAGETPPACSLTTIERLLRGGSGLALLGLAYQGGFQGFYLGLAFLSVALMFARSMTAARSGVH